MPTVLWVSGDMGERVYFATANKTNGFPEDNVLGTSGFSGFPFPVYFAKKWQGEWARSEESWYTGPMILDGWYEGFLEPWGEFTPSDPQPEVTLPSAEALKGCVARLHPNPLTRPFIGDQTGTIGPMTLEEAVACWWRVKIWELEIEGSATGSIEAGGWDPETEAEYPRIEASADTAVNGDCTVPPNATVFDFRGVNVKGAKTGRAIQPDGAEYPVAEITCNLSGSGTVGQVYCDIDSPKDYYLAFSVGVTAGSWARDQWMDGVSKGSYIYFPAWTPSDTWDYEEGVATPSSKTLTVTLPSGRTLTVDCQF